MRAVVLLVFVLSACQGAKSAPRTQRESAARVEPPPVATQSERIVRLKIDGMT